MSLAWKVKAKLLRSALKGELSELHFDWTRDGGADARAVLSSPAGRILAHLLCGFLRECGAPNFVTMECSVGEAPERASIIIQKWGGETPAAVLQRQSEEIARLKAEMEKLGGKS